MRIVVHPTTEVGLRAVELLLAESGVEVVGTWGPAPRRSDPRLRRVDGLAGWDVVATDDVDGYRGIVARAAAVGVPAVVWADGEDLASGPVLRGANLAMGIAPSLLTHPLCNHPGPRFVAWTEPGRRLRRGIPVPFPDPVGRLWAASRPSTGDVHRAAAPVPGEWAGALATAGEGRERAVVAVADLAVHLESIALAAGAVVVARCGAPDRPRGVAAAGGAYLEAARRIGLELAVAEA